MMSSCQVVNDIRSQAMLCVSEFRVMVTHWSVIDSKKDDMEGFSIFTKSNYCISPSKKQNLGLFREIKEITPENEMVKMHKQGKIPVMENC